MKKLQSLGSILSSQQMKKIAGGYDTCQIICNNGNTPPSPPPGSSCQEVCAAAVSLCNNEGHYVHACCGGC